MAQKAIKLGISQAGWYRVALSTLAANGMNAGNGKRLHLYAEGIEQPLELRAGGVEFYATGLDTPSTATRVYWLTNGAPSKNRIATSKVRGHASAGADFLASVERQDRSVYFAAANASDGIDFFGQFVSSTPLDQSVPAAHLSGPDNAMLEVGLQGATKGAHNVTVALNGVSLGTVSFSDLGIGVASFAASSIRDGDNTGHSERDHERRRQPDRSPYADLPAHLHSPTATRLSSPLPDRIGW